ncbi:MAG: S41 family peptidase [Polyangiaceae bacterium]|nr:S41 family peptidase [Polyangiaceae bacterium]
MSHAVRVAPPEDIENQRNASAPPRRPTRSIVDKLLRYAALTLCAFAGGACAGGLSAATAEADSPYGFLRQLARVLVLVESEYVEPVDRERLLEGAIKGMVAELDPHSAYYPPRDFAVRQADTQGKFGGVGVEVEFQNDKIIVITPIEGSPAARAGILSGDEIVTIDRVPVHGKAVPDLVRRMRGESGSTVTISVRRKGHEKLLVIALKREIIRVASVGSKLLEGKIAYIRLKQFHRGTHEELLEQVGQLRRAAGGAPLGLLLDLRNNPGGLVDEAAAVADELLSDMPIYSTRHRGEIVEEVHANRGGALSDLPMTALVNQYTISAAELIAGALQDNHRASLVGAQSFGKGSVQTYLDLPGGAGLVLTTMRYYTPKGRSIQAQGVRPDVLVEAAYVADRSFGILRESDHENHLPAEGATGKDPPDAKVIRQQKYPEKNADGISDTHMGMVRDVPFNPAGGPDFALSIGYQMLRETVRKLQHEQDG